MTPIGLGDRAGDSREMRTFAQILADEKENRNILEIKLRKITTYVDNDQVSVKPISTEDLSVLLFEVIKLKPGDCAGVALYTSRYDTKEVKLRPGVDPTPYLTGSTPIFYKDHEIEVKDRQKMSPW